jgi:hypothetical protein
VKGSHAVRVFPGKDTNGDGHDDDNDHEGDRHEDDDLGLPASIWYALSAPAGNCMDASVAWIAGQPASGTAVKCIKVTNFAVPKHHKAKIDINFEFRYKNTAGWGSTAQTAFRAGFSFRSNTVISLSPSFLPASLAGKTYVGNQSVGVVGVGQKVTAIGGFVYSSLGNPVENAQVRLYNSLPAGLTPCSTNDGVVAQSTTMVDGFYFIWKTGSEQSEANLSNLASGIKYYVGICVPADPTVLVVPPAVVVLAPAFAAGRYINHKLETKEFYEETFYITVP